jgi:hypothetical protein
MEEAAAAQTKRISPFQDRPLAVLKDVLHDAYHLRSGEFVGEHLANSRAADDGSFSHLVVRSILAVQRGESCHIGSVESVDPGVYELPWLHERSNVHSEARAPLLRASLSTVLLDGFSLRG